MQCVCVCSLPESRVHVMYMYYVAWFSLFFLYIFLGINLVSIEHSPCKQDEAWSNINAFNDVIKAVVTMTDKATVAVLQGNAGAGGAMFAVACDVVVAHPVSLVFQIRSLLFKSIIHVVL